MLLVEKLLYSSKYVVLADLHINVTIFFNLLKKNINNKSHKRFIRTTYLKIFNNLILYIDKIKQRKSNIFMLGITQHIDTLH